MEIKAIGGLFNTHGELQQALQELAIRGYGQQAYSIVGTAAPAAPRTDIPAARSKGLMRALFRLGLSGSHAEYYVDGIQQGGVLLVLHGIEANRLTEVHHVLQEQGARFAR